MTSGELFCGGGLASIGTRAAGYEPAWAIERDPTLAECYRFNLGNHVICAAVEEIDPGTLAPVDLLWASPPCPAFSIARSKNLPQHESHDAGLSIIPYLETLMPAAFIMENVPPYAHSEPFRLIVTTLQRLGYVVDWQNVNSAWYGVPQSRNRLILRATWKGLLRPLPPREPPKGWYAAIEDLIPTLPETQFANWQLKRLQQTDLGRSFLHMTGNTNLAQPSGTGVCAIESPSNTVTQLMPRAFLVDGQNGNAGRSLTIRRTEECANTITNCAKAYPRMSLVTGRVVRITPRALARLQTVPDWYELPARKALALRIIGNGVPCKLAEVLARNMVSE